MAHFIKDTGFKTNMNGMENIFLHSMIRMKVNGEMEKKMGLEKKYLEKKIYMKVNGKMEKKMEMEH